MDDFRLMADAVEADINAGRLAPGTRLSPQRAFARERGIATSTAARVYQELERRGLVAGEIGRGTFVRARAGAAPARPGSAEAQPGSGGMVDLEANFPVLAEQAAMIGAALGDLLRSEGFAASLLPIGVAGALSDRGAASTFLARGTWRPDPANLLFTGSGRQSIATAISGLVGPGQRLGVEELTYPIVKSIAANLGVTLVPIALDSEGIIPASLREVHQATPLRALYLQPSLHNPLGTTMSHERMRQVADLLADLDLPAIEDGVNCFLRDDEPLSTFAPDHTVYVDSLAKRIAPGLNLGIMVTPRRLRERLAAVIRSGTWSAPGFALAAARTLISDGTAARIVALKRADAANRQHIVLDRLRDFTVDADPGAYHSWWTLPEPWSAETFVAAAARRGIVVSPAGAFAVGPPSSDRLRRPAIRLSNSSPSVPTLTETMDLLADLAHGTPDDSGLEF